MVTYSVDRKGADRNDSGSLKIPVDKKEKRPTRRRFLFDFLPPLGKYIEAALRDSHKELAPPLAGHYDFDDLFRVG